MESCCGTCEHHRCDIKGEWVCGNPESDYFTDYTEYKDYCEDYEERN